MDWAMHIVEEVRQERNRNNLPDKVICASVIPYWYKFKEGASAFDGLIRLGDGKEKKVTFVTYPETQAKSMVANTSGLNHDAILRVWFATYCNTRNMWLVCYDRFDCYLRPWLNRKNNATKVVPLEQSGDVLNPWWCDFISMVLEVAHYMHSRGSYHGDLSCIGSFVMVGKKVKLVNIGNGFHGRHGPGALSHKLSDLKAFRDLLRDELKPEIECEDRDLFLGYFDKYSTLMVNQGYDYFVWRLITHPYLLTAKERLEYFFKVHWAIIHRTILLPSTVGTMLDNNFASVDGFGQFTDWVAKIGSNSVLVRIKDYKKDAYDGQKIEHLIKYLRNLYAHGARQLMLKRWTKGSEPNCVRSLQVAYMKFFFCKWTSEGLARRYEVLPDFDMTRVLSVGRVLSLG